MAGVPCPVWAYGVTTVPKRRNTTLPKTLECLSKGGFPTPRLFVDGENNGVSWELEFGLEVTCRNPLARAFPSWLLGVSELYVRYPRATHYAMFQDDLLCSRNLRRYLERTWPGDGTGYLNLFAHEQNEKKGIEDKLQGWYHGNQFGLGAVALCFTREALGRILATEHLWEKPRDARARYSQQNIDGAVVTACWKLRGGKGKGGDDWKEWVHYPALTAHQNAPSTLGHGPYPKASKSFKGAHSDCLALLPVQETP